MQLIGMSNDYPCGGDRMKRKTTKGLGSQLASSLCQISTSKGSGTGFAAYTEDVHKHDGVSKYNFIVTCGSLIEDEGKITISQFNLDKYEPDGRSLKDLHFESVMHIEIESPHILMQDHTRDIAIIEAPDLPFQPLSPSEGEAQLLTSVLTGGYPAGVGSPRMTPGSLSGVEVIWLGPSMFSCYTIEPLVDPGFNGGPILGQDGELIGMMRTKGGNGFSEQALGGSIDKSPSMVPIHTDTSRMCMGHSIPLFGLKDMLSIAYHHRQTIHPEVRRQRNRTVGSLRRIIQCRYDDVGTLKVPRGELARLQRWFIKTVGNPTPRLGCNEMKECWVYKPRGYQIIPEECNDVTDVILDFFLHRRMEGGRFYITGRHVLSYDTTKNSYARLVAFDLVD